MTCTAVSLGEVATIALAVVVAAVVLVLLLRTGVLRLGPKSTFSSASMVDRVRAVGRLVCLQVFTKEIATSQAGFAWIPEIIFRGRKMAMIFHFEKEYFVDLMRLKPEDVQRLDDRRYRVTLPPVEGVERMTNMEPYDIQSGKLLGLLEVMPNDAKAQKELTTKAQEQAVALFRMKDPQYAAQARSSAERQIKSLLSMFDVDAEVAWTSSPSEREAVTAALPRAT